MEGVSVRAYLPKSRARLVLGSGAQIGQASEFTTRGRNASGLREEGIFTVLVNPNIATIQTSTGLADKIYLTAVTPEFVEAIIVKEEVDAIVLAFGGQTALNCGLALDDAGILDRYGVRVLGTPVKAIRDTEDRVLRLAEIGVARLQRGVPLGGDARREIGFPLRGLAGRDGVVETAADMPLRRAFMTECGKCWSGSACAGDRIRGRRDGRDGFITVCNMENFDAMGIHTGESIVVAPSGARCHEYQMLRTSR
jgi:carbamoyl-phosphate synthase large subunit